MVSIEILAAFDQFLAGRGLELEAVVVGGTALNLLGVVSRPTRDCDILHPTLSPPVKAAAHEFAADIRTRGELLSDDWLNNGPAELVSTLTPGWQDRLVPAFAGAALRLRTLGRADFIAVKLFALCDRGIDLPDCVALAPTSDELAAVRPWLEAQDAHPGWPDHVRSTLADLERKLGRGL